MATIEERLAVLETEMGTLKEAVYRIDDRTRRLDEAYTMGRGAWKAAMKIGGVLLLAAGALAWLFDRVPQWLKG